MQLTDEQKAILQGKLGPLLAKYMRWSVDWGDAMGAERLVPVTNVHCILRTPLLKGISQKTVESFIGEIRDICSHKVKCTTTTHQHSYCKESVSEKEFTFQEKLNELAREAGFITTWTCTPYLVGNVPTCGQICAWTESSAIVYANSILGARTTRHGMQSSIAAALLGWVPEFGVLLSRNRKATLQVNVESHMRTPSDWGALGFYTGEIGGSEIPVFTQVETILPEEAKQLSAALPYSGRAISMFHIVGVTPEAATLETALGPHKPSRRIVFNEKNLVETYRKITDLTRGEEIDTVTLGCPFASLQEIKEISDHLYNKHIAPGVALFISTSYGTMKSAKRIGYTEIIKKAGGTFMVGTCPSGAKWLHLEKVVTNSFKMGFCCRNAFKAKIGVTNEEDCLGAAIRGRWQR